MRSVENCGSGKTLAILAEDCGATHPEWSSQSVLSEHIHRKSNASSEGRSSRSLPSNSSPGIRLEVYDTSFWEALHGGVFPVFLGTINPQQQQISWKTIGFYTPTNLNNLELPSHWNSPWGTVDKWAAFETLVGCFIYRGLDSPLIWYGIVRSQYIYIHIRIPMNQTVSWNFIRILFLLLKWIIVRSEHASHCL